MHECARPAMLVAVWIDGVQVRCTCVASERVRQLLGHPCVNTHRPRKCQKMVDERASVV